MADNSSVAGGQGVSRKDANKGQKSLASPRNVTQPMNIVLPDRASTDPSRSPGGSGIKKSGQSASPTNSVLQSGSPATAAAVAPPKAAALRQVKPPPIRRQHDTKDQKSTQKVVVRGATFAKEVPLFSHLPQHERPSTVRLTMEFTNKIHPAILQLGLRIADGSIGGANSRCVSMLLAFRAFISDYETPDEKSLFRDLDASLKPLIQFLVDCRPLSISMGNAIKNLKTHITRTQDMSDKEAKEYLVGRIDAYVEERVEMASALIVRSAAQKIEDGDVLLLFASVHTVARIAETAFQEGRRFRIIVCDSNPHLRGKALLRKLSKKHQIDCTYVLIEALSYIMPEVTKVFVGASALLANGYLLSTVGTALVAMQASYHHVPFIVCCETYKFCERVQLDSICFNELGDPNELLSVQPAGHASDAASVASSGGAGAAAAAAAPAAAAAAAGGSGGAAAPDNLSGWMQQENLRLLNIIYDLTPSQYITAVITEVGIIPSTSVPVILREYSEDRDIGYA